MLKRRRTLPPVSPKTPGELRPLMSAIAEVIETGEGVRGDPLDRKVTLRDLKDSGIGKFRDGLRPGANGSLQPGDNDAPPDMSTPPAPALFTADGSFYGMINLSWSIPSTLYGNHAITRIYRSEKDNFANAEVVGEEAGAFYSDFVRDDALDPDDDTKAKGYYYWISFVSTSGVEGPPNSPNGTYAAPLLDAGYIIEKITGKIDEGVLAGSLKGKIDKIGPIETEVDKIGAIETEVEKIGPLESAVDDLDNSTARRISDERDARIAAAKAARDERILQIQAEADARTDALSTQRDEWLDKIADERGDIDTVIEQKETESRFEDEYLAGLQRVIAATKKTSSASFYTLEQSRVTDQAAMATRISLLDSSMEGNRAQILEQADVFSNAVSAVSRSVDQVSTEVDGNRGLIVEESKSRSDDVSALTTQIGLLSAKLDALPTFANGFEPGPEFDSWQASTGHAISEDSSDAFAGLQAALVSSTSASVDASSSPFAVYVKVPQGSATTFLGKRLRLSVAAQQPGTSAAAEFAMGYAVGSDWFSGWSRFAPESSWSVSEVTVDVPEEVSGDHYIALWGDTSGAGLATRMDRLLVEAIQSEIPEVSAAIEAIRQAYVAADEALAEESQRIDARVDDANSAIQREASARTDAVSSVTNRLDEAVSQFGDDIQAAITEERNTSADETDAVSSRVDDMQATVGGFDARITEEAEVRAQEDRLSGMVQGVMSAARGASSSTTFSLEEVRVTDSEAMARQLEGVLVDVDDNRAMAQVERRARIADHLSMAEQVVEVQSGLDDGLSTVRQDFGTIVERVDGDIAANAQAVIDAQTEFGDAISGVTQDFNSEIERVDGNTTANAEANTSLRADLEEASSTITEEQKVRSSEDTILGSIQRVVTAARGAASATTISLEEVRVADDEIMSRQIEGVQVGLNEARAMADLERYARISDSQSAARQITRVQADLGGDISTVKQDFDTEVLRLEGLTSANATAITGAQSELGDDIAQVQTNLTTNINRVDGEIESIGAQYTAEVQANGLIGGFGVYNDGTTVEAGFDVDRFWVGRTDDEKRKPFIIDGDTTYMDEAMIRQASIQEGQLGPITIGKLEKSDGTPVTTVGGLIRADSIDVNNLSVAEAAKFSGDVSSHNFKSGSKGWLIRQDGYVEFNEAMIRGNLEIDSITVNGQPPYSGVSASGSNYSGSLKVGYQATESRYDWGSSSTFTRSYQTYVYKALKNSRLSVRVYPKGEIRITDGWSMGGSIRLNVYMRVKVWINGSLRHNKNTRLAYNSSRYNKTYTHPSYSSGIPLSYTFPSYASSAKVKMQVSINLQDYDYRGSYAYGYFYSTAYIRGNNVISGELSRLG